MSEQVIRDLGEDAWWASQVPGPFEPAYEFVYRVLRHAVLAGTLPPGRHLLQTEIAERLSLSTTPVREAFRRLASETLIDTVPGRGAVVRTLSLDELDEIVAIRGLLEVHVLRLAAERMSGEALARMEQLHTAITKERDVAAWVDLNRQFHRVYYDAAESPRLRAILNGLHDAVSAYVAAALRELPTLPERGNQEHAALVKGLRERDVDALQQLIRIHITVDLALPQRAQTGQHEPPWV